MSEYVYALHDFSPEHEDEISFKAGQRIEVIEKDDQYNDGWWQGRNLAGKIGLFPQSYTAPAPPLTVLPPSTSASSGEPVTTPSDSPGGHSEGPDATSGRNGDAQPRIGIAIGALDSTDGEMMKATMTDVQKAIEQLGKSDRDGAQSFSFASSRDGDTDRETDGTETDGEIGDGWHRSARDKLAEQARKVVEAQAAAEAEAEAMHVRTSAPPIDVELSDESEAEDEDEDDSAFHHMQHIHFTHDHPHIPEEDEEEEARQNSVAMDRRRSNSNETSSAILPSDDRPSPVDESGERTAMANQTSFASASPPPRSTRSPAPNVKRSPQLLPTPTTPNAMHIVAPIPKVPVTVPEIPVTSSPEPVLRARATPTPSITRDIPASLPSPALTASGTRHSRHTSQQNSIASTGKGSAFRAQSPPAPAASEPSKKPASEWTVDEVVEWLKLKGFGPDVYEKFIEQEITGDVLLELDINLLKAEIGIVAFGKRMRIANAIAELRRPPSIILPEHQPQSITRSVSQSFTYAHSPSGSMQLSLHSPMHANMSAAVNTPHSGNGNLESPRADLFSSPLVPKRVSSLSSAGASVNGGNSGEGTSVTAAVEKATMLGIIGLGLSPLASPKLPPSGSDGGLAPSETPMQGENAEEDRGAQSEGEAPQVTAKQHRRRLFGRSVESSSSWNKDKSETASEAKDTSSPPSVSGTASPRPRKREVQDDSSITRRGKRGSEIGHKGTERHSLFGGAFPTPLGKSRKPAPRVTSTLLEESSPTEKASTLSLSRLYSTRKSSSGRPSTSDGSTLGSPKDFKKEREKSVELEKSTPKLKPSELKDPETLRKQTKTPQGGARGPNSLKPGKSIIEQIGQPDHQGWMRKKGDHYNTWKMRFFIIKGPHLYILRSNSRTEMKIKGYVNIQGYKVVADENIDPGRYGFRIVHDTDKTHFFSHDEQAIVREWMKAIMKATIGRDYTKPVVSSVNIATIPLTVAQAMNPAPRPPSPTARAATQKAMRRENPNQLSTRDARILMGLPSIDNGHRIDDAQESERIRLESFFANQPVSTEVTENGGTKTPKPPRPTREGRRTSVSASDALNNAVDPNLIEWANSHLPRSLQVIDPAGALFGGLALLRLAEDMMGKAASPSIPDSAFPSGPNDDKLDGLFRLFDFLLDNDVKMGAVSINDVRQGKRDKIMQLLKALKGWEDRRREIAKSVGQVTLPALSGHSIV